LPTKAISGYQPLFFLEKWVKPCLYFNFCFLWNLSPCPQAPWT
jgi:hypothetical protein